MRILFDDGESQLCAQADQCQICVAEVLIGPDPASIRLNKVWDDPPTYSKLAIVLCELIRPGHFVMTATGLKRVREIEDIF